MSKINNNPDLSALSRLFKKYSDIDAVYLFGSHLTGKMHSESDIDLAVVPANSKTIDKKLDILTDLAKHGFCHVDLIFLDVHDIVLKYEAVRNNKVIYQNENFDHGDYFSKVLRQYFDFLPYLEVQRRAYKEKILNG